MRSTAETLLPETAVTQMPRTLYYSEIRPQDSGAGASLVYRLLKHFPADRLLVVNQPVYQQVSGRQLENCSQSGLPKNIRTSFVERFSRSRFAQIAGTCAWLNSYKTPRRFLEAAQSFRPQAVLSVAHGSSWHTAYRFSQSRRIPFFLIVHDEYGFTINMTARFKNRAVGAFTDAYRTAADVFCVSPYMESCYSLSTGRAGSILLPGRDRDNDAYSTPKPASQQTPITVGYAGGLHNPGYRQLTSRLAEIATGLGFRFVIFGPHAPEFSVRRKELFEYKGNLASADLIEKLRSSADVLFCPQSFAPHERHAMETNFPSKLTDYTATGLPLLIWGPAYSSSVQWASQHTGVAAVVEQDDDDAARRQLQTLLDGNVRLALARKSMEVGNQLFSADVAFQVLAESLSLHTSRESREFRSSGRDSRNVATRAA